MTADDLPADRWPDLEPSTAAEWRALVEDQEGEGALERQRALDVYGEPVEICNGPAPAYRSTDLATKGAHPWEVWWEGPLDAEFPAPLLDDDEAGRGVWWSRQGGDMPAADRRTLARLPPRFGVAVDPHRDQPAVATRLLDQLVAAGIDRHGCLGLDPSAANLASVARRCVEEAPRMRAVLIDSSPWHNVGATPATEVGLAIAAGVAGLSTLLHAGLSPEQAAGQVLFAVDVGRDVLREVAKLRALRLLWQALCRRVGVADPAATTWVHGRTARRTKSVIEPWNNALRGTVECVAAVLGGARSVACRPHDELTGGSTAAARLAVQTQHVLRTEAKLHAAADAAGGSFAVEAWTSEIAERAWQRVQQVEARGGVLAALASGWVRAEIAQEAAARRRQLAHREALVTSVTSFSRPGEPVPLVSSTSDHLSASSLPPAWRDAEPFEALLASPGEKAPR